MVVFISVFGGLLFSILIYAFVFLILIKRRKLKLLDWFLLSLGTFNGIGFGFVIWTTYEGRNPYSGIQRLMQYDVYTSIIFLLSNVILLGSVLFGWYLAPTFKRIFKLGFKKIPNNTNIINETYFIKSFIFVAWLMLLVAIVSYWLYTRPYGGFIGLLNHSRAIRAGVSSINNPLSFLKAFGGFSFFASYLFFGSLFDKKYSKKTFYFGFIISFLFSVYVLYSWMGRVSLAVYLLTFILGYILYNYKSVISFIRKVILFVISAFLLILVSDAILGESKNGVVGMLAKEISFPFVSYVIQINNTDFRWFQDLIVAPLYLLPKRIWNGIFNIETASSYNTFIIAGARKGDGVSGSIPIDMLTLGHLQASIFGILVVGLLWGAFLFNIEQLLKKIKNRGFYSIIYANVILNVVVLSTSYGDPNHILTRNFPLIAGALILWICMKLSLKKNGKAHIKRYLSQYYSVLMK